MKIDVKKVSELAKIPLTDEELTNYQSELETIISFVEKLNEVNTDAVEPTNQVTGIENAFHEDVVDEAITFTTKDATANAKESDGSYIVTEGVFDER